MATKNLLMKNIPYGGVRSVIPANQSGADYTYFSEGSGNRYYVNQISSTASPTLESATFDSYLSFTMSHNQTFYFDLVPMDKGNSVVINTIIYAQNKAATKGFVQKSFGAWKHSGSTLTHVGAGMSDIKESDFPTGQLTAQWSAGATQSIRLTCSNTTSDEVDFDIHISYTKGYHSVITPPNTNDPVSPPYPTS